MRKLVLLIMCCCSVCKHMSTHILKLVYDNRCFCACLKQHTLQSFSTMFRFLSYEAEPASLDTSHSEDAIDQSICAITDLIQKIVKIIFQVRVRGGRHVNSYCMGRLEWNSVIGRMLQICTTLNRSHCRCGLKKLCKETVCACTKVALTIKCLMMLVQSLVGNRQRYQTCLKWIHRH